MLAPIAKREVILASQHEAWRGAERCDRYQLILIINALPAAVMVLG